MSEQQQRDVAEPSSLMASVGVGVIQTVMFVYDFVTFPVYYACQRPWRAVDAGRRVRAEVVAKTDSEVHYRPTFKTCAQLEEFKAAGIDTMDKCLKVRSMRRASFLLPTSTLTGQLLSFFVMSGGKPGWRIYCTYLI